METRMWKPDTKVDPDYRCPLCHGDQLEFNHVPMLYNRHGRCVDVGDDSDIRVYKCLTCRQDFDSPAVVIAKGKGGLWYPMHDKWSRRMIIVEVHTCDSKVYKVPCSDTESADIFVEEVVKNGYYTPPLADEPNKLYRIRYPAHEIVCCIVRLT